MLIIEICRECGQLIVILELRVYCEFCIGEY